MDKLNIDKGYISRILKRFEANGFISKESSATDGRAFFIYPTSKGRQILSILEEKSNNQVQKLIKHLTENEQEKLVQAMKYIAGTLQFSAHPVNIRTFQLKDIEHIIKKHRNLYALEYGFTSAFGDYVADAIRKFVECYDETEENIWVAEINEIVIGVIAIVKVDDTTAQLRWFLIDPEMRGRGLGHRLMRTVIDFCKAKNYQHVLLWTANLLEAARNLYQSYGFTLTETAENNTWSEHLIKEERWDLYLQ
jgi:ribosomal protein S18 acetylase RimI-like enzyme